MKKRLDVLLAERGLAASRERAKSMILAGNVYVDGRKMEKAGIFLEEDAVPEVRGEALRYVSRGGLKLEKALAVWKLDLEDAVCLDIGASAGGFTDCMLQSGAVKVYAVDAGKGQLADRLRADARVVCMEQRNFRYFTQKDIGEAPDFAGADVSFISLTKILPAARDVLKEGGRMVCLVKPQFEAGRDKVGKNGVVRDPKIHMEVLGRIIDFAEGIGFSVQGLEYSPIKGPEGNIEYLICLEKRLGQEEMFQDHSEVREGEPGPSQKWAECIARTVERARKSL